MRIVSSAPLALLLLAACTSTNPFGTGGGGGGTPTDITVPDSLAGDVDAVAYDAARDALIISITLDTTPVQAVWQRDSRFDTAGYRAYAVQEDPLDRLFIGLAAQSPDRSVTAVVAGDGGQFNKFYAGGGYSRNGAFAPPQGTAAQGSGQVSYAGRYAGITNIPAPGTALLPPVSPVDPEVRPNQASRVEGDIFLNANFSDNVVNGAIYNRVVVDYGFRLQSVILVGGEIDPNGSFVGTTERWVNDDQQMEEFGDFGGVFGGQNAGYVGGVVALEKIFVGDAVLGLEVGDELEGGRERGMFMLRQCGLSDDSPICDGARPDFSN
jgi:hypothetical protein